MRDTSNSLHLPSRAPGIQEPGEMCEQSPLHHPQDPGSRREDLLPGQGLHSVTGCGQVS